jgi:hypothetical protein
VESSVSLRVECADVLEAYFQVVEPKRLLCQAHLFEAGLP